MDAFFRTLPGVFEAIDASEEVRRAFVFAAWRRVAGGQIVERTTPIEIANNRLVIAVADKTWKRNLETLASQLVFKLNSMLGKPLVEFIEFRIEPDRVRHVKTIETDPAADVFPIPVEISASAASIADANLRTQFIGAAVNCLARIR